MKWAVALALLTGLLLGGWAVAVRAQSVAQAPTPTDIDQQREIARLEVLVDINTKAIVELAAENAKVRQTGFERLAAVEAKTAENRSLLGALMALLAGDLATTVALFRKIRNNNNNNRKVTA